MRCGRGLRAREMVTEEETFEGSLKRWSGLEWQTPSVLVAQQVVLFRGPTGSAGQ